MNTAEQLRDEGIAQVLANNEVWRQSFFNTADTVLNRDGSVNSEIVVEICGYPPGHPSAIGGAMRAFAKARGLWKTSYVNSSRPSSHAAVIAIWSK